MTSEVIIKGKVAQYKIDEVSLLKDLIEKHNVIGLCRMEELGARQVQNLRSILRGNAIIKMSKNTLVARALEEGKDKKNLEKLIDYIQGSCAFIFTNMNPFKLRKILDENKMKASVRPGFITTDDIMVPAGNTGFPPGPLITQFNDVGLPTRIESGSIFITKSTIVARKGDEIDRLLALVLSRLKIEPREVKLNLFVAYDDGVILTDEDLSFSRETFVSQLKEAYSNTFNLSVNVAYPTPQNIGILLQRASLEAKAFAVHANIVTPEVINDLIIKTHNQMLSLAIEISKHDASAVPTDLIGIPTPVIEKKPVKTEEIEKEKEQKEEKEKKEEEIGGLGDFLG